MPVVNSALPTFTEPQTTHGGGGGGPHHRLPGGGGGDGGHRGDDAPDFGEQLRRYRLGLAIGLSAVVMLFISLSSVFLVREGLGTWDPATNTYISDWHPLQLPLTLLLVNSGILLASSITVEKARRVARHRAIIAPATAIPGVSEGHERRVPWLWITIVLGLGFLIGQVAAWQRIQRHGSALAVSPSSSFFYVLTGAHALHLVGGLLALFYAALLSLRSRALERRGIVIDVAAWYWHFLTLLWIYIFVLLKFAA